MPLEWETKVIRDPNCTEFGIELCCLLFEAALPLNGPVETLQ